jgi:NAD(P)-dependent dehydrogenase (short-subunit alcohol dehydrogenase family)
MAMDVDSDESAEQCIAGILKENGPVDVLVNNAGIERHGSVEELTLSDFKSVMETNYFGVLRCMKALLPEVLKNRVVVLLMFLPLPVKSPAHHSLHIPPVNLHWRR